MTSARPLRWDLFTLGLALLAALTPASTLWTLAAVLGLATVGLGHGAYDLDLRRSDGWLFVAAYLCGGAATLALWCVSPVAGLTLFLCASVWHFGQAELAHLHLFGLRRMTLFASRGLMMLGLPLGLRFADAAPILQHLGFSGALAVSATLASVTGLICGVQHLVVLVVAVPKRHRARELLSAAPAALFVSTLPLATGFMLAFSLGHAVSHLQAVDLSARTAASHRRALLFWGVALAGTIVGIASIGWFDETSQLWAGAFAALAALTTPHMLVVDRWHAAKRPRRVR